VLNHKPIKVLRLSTSNLAAFCRPGTRSLHQKLAAGYWTGEIRGKPLQLGKSYYREKDTQEDKNRREGNRKPAWQIRDT